MTKDWKWLVDVVKVREDSRYAHEDGKPVVLIRGLPFPDRGISKAKAHAVVDFFVNDPVYGGNYVVGGVPSWWRTQTDWYDHFWRCQAVLAWMPQDRTGYVQDADQLRAWGMDYFPHVWPGFSWANLQKQTGNVQLAPREGRAFCWDKINQALPGNSERLFVGIFGEYDEGTAIMPMTDDPPNPPPDWGRFITNDGRPSDWWMLLAEEAKAMLVDQRATGGALPSEGELANLSNVGSEASIDLGSADKENRLVWIDVRDGHTAAEIVAGRECRFNQSPATDLYFYFNVDDSFALREAAGPSSNPCRGEAEARRQLYSPVT